MADLPEHNPAAPVQEPEVKRPDLQVVINTLASYRTEAEQARDGGHSPRTKVWENNWKRYWGLYDFSNKASWQSQHVFAEVPQYVDRWAAAMRKAWDATADQIEIEDEMGTGITEPLIPHIKRTMKALLGRCARTPDGHQAPFSSLFEEQMKLGAIMALCSTVTWQMDANGGSVRVSTVDPREVRFDPKERGLYRWRHYEIDKHELVAMASRLDEFGLPIYDLEQLDMLGAEVDPITDANRELSTGGGKGTDQGRTPIQIDEWRATILEPQTGKLICDRALIVVANSKFVIRGPEVNPYWHNEDWLVFTPLVTVPLSIYGRTYMEDWAPTADAYIEMTNLVLDAVQTSTMKAFAAQPDMLQDPNQLVEGIRPNLVYLMAEGIIPNDFLKEIELGQLPQDAIIVLKMLKEELREGAKLSEIALGQMPNKTHISAEGIQQSAQNGSAMMSSMASTIETRWLEPTLNLIWATALQYMDFLSIADEIGQETAAMLQAQRRQFFERRFRFRFRGISGLIDRQQKLQSMMQMLQIVGQNQLLAQALFAKVNPDRLLDTLFVLFGIDPKSIEFTQQELMQAQIQRMAAGQGQPQLAAPAPQGASQ